MVSAKYKGKESIIQVFFYIVKKEYKEKLVLAYKHNTFLR